MARSKLRLIQGGRSPTPPPGPEPEAELPDLSVADERALDVRGLDDRDLISEKAQAIFEAGKDAGGSEWRARLRAVIERHWRGEVADGNLVIAVMNLAIVTGEDDE